ncbi:uncharacterized protein LOC120941743 [Rana temporaria]|uniref:uncharacterized protein LOC120941743 n=1 Tax=Rana temporaria TaxID=8407 RepID=UPI001AADE9E6|nr:uncharacterized protein LOC120941743 [Rana temporaria]XP_040211308.1 uncharacterized protein LOC120941743 [Rana temporaria]
MRMAAYLAVALVVLSVIAEAEGSRDRAVRSSAPAEPMRRRGSVTQRGRKKTIWSYNPGHRSLAFLVAGEIEVVSPPPGDAVTGAEYRCLGCCGERTPFGSKTTSSPQPSNRVGRLVLRPDGLAVIGTEPNSVNDRCLGCCEDSVTPINGVTTTVTTSGTTTATTTTTTKAGVVMKVPITGRQRVWQAPRGAPYENPNWRFESSSSSEEISRVRHPPRRSRFQPIRSRVEERCRHLGCRSPLGSIVDDSSSSEED